jgi:hypothetical protein
LSSDQELGISDLDGRLMGREVLAAECDAWIVPFSAALTFQHRNPDVGAKALEQPSDGPEMAMAMVHQLATWHPRVLARCIAWCESVATEMRREPIVCQRDRNADPVAPVAHTPDVENERDGGGGQQQDQAAELQERVERLERWHAELEDEVVRLRWVIADAGAQASRPTNTA